MTYYSSDAEFNLIEALKAKIKAKQPRNVHKFERFTNEDYSKLESHDFRSYRYRRKQLLTDQCNSDEELCF